MTIRRIAGGMRQIAYRACLMPTYRAYPMMCPAIGFTVALELSKRDSFTGGVNANPKTQVSYGIFVGGGVVQKCRGEGPAYKSGWAAGPDVSTQLLGIDLYP